MARIIWNGNIQVKDVPPRGGKRTIELEYEYGLPQGQGVRSLDSVIDKIRNQMNGLGFEEKDTITLKKISIIGD